MPLVALKDGERVCTLDFASPADLRAAVPAGSARCPDCGGEFVLKAGFVKAPHFAHKPSANCSPLERKGESLMHLLSKAAIREYLMKRHAGEGVRVELEYRFPGVRRIADVCAIFPDGTFHVHEAQFADITQAELEARTSDYEIAGASAVMWWFGGANARSSAATGYALERCGHYCVLRVEDAQESFAAIPRAA